MSADEMYHNSIYKSGDMVKAVKKANRKEAWKRRSPTLLNLLRIATVVFCGYKAYEAVTDNRLSREDFDGEKIKWVQVYNPDGSVEDNFRDSGISFLNKSLYDSLVAERNESLEGDIYLPVMRE